MQQAGIGVDGSGAAPPVPVYVFTSPSHLIPALSDISRVVRTPFPTWDAHTDMFMSTLIISEFRIQTEKQPQDPPTD